MATHQKKHIKDRVTNSKELIIRDQTQGEKYGEVVRATGNCRFECRFLDNSTTNAPLAGKLIKGPHKQRITPGDFVLLQALIDKNKYYIIHKYSPDDKKKLAKNGELAQINAIEQIGTTVIIESEIANKKEKVINDIDDIAELIENI
jgi:translation initiation factor IF-1